MRSVLVRTILLAALALILVGASTRAWCAPSDTSAQADSAASSDTSTDSGAAFLLVRKAVVGPFQSLVSSSRNSFSLDDYAGQTLEISGRVSGKVRLDNGVMLIIETKFGSLNVSVASDNNWQWLDTGCVIRALVSVPDSQAIVQLRSIVPMIASAPEAAVEQAERDAAEVAKRDAATHAAKAAQARRVTSGPSRSASYDDRANLEGGHPIAPLSDAALSVYGAYRSFIASANSRLSARQVDTITTSILYYSEVENLDPRLVISMIIAESNFDPYSTSRTGAMGLGQLMPGTAAGLGVANAYDPIQNIGAAVHILSSNVKTYGGSTARSLVPINTLILTMAAYNAGSGAVRRYQGVPPYRETQRYVRKVAAIYKKICGM